MATEAHHADASAPHAPGERPHPGAKAYIGVAAILAVITLVEVILFYLDMPDVALVLGLLALSGAKFGLVVLWFMHLRFDSRLFRRLFLAGLILAITVYTIVLISFGVLID